MNQDGGNVRDGRVTNPELQFDWEEVEECGTCLDHLRPGDRFACVLSAAPDGCGGMATYTGKLIYPGVGSALVQLDRSWEDRVRWQPQTKVIPLPKQHQANRRRVSLDPATFIPEEE